MTNKQMSRYLILLDRRGAIMSHSGPDWRPEYNKELQQIEKEMAVLRAKADEEAERSRSEDGRTSVMPKMVPLTKESKETGLSYGFLKGLISEGKIIYVMAGKKILVNHDSVLDYLERGDSDG